MSFLSRTSAVRGRTPMDENVANWLYLGPRISPAVPESPRWNAACRFLSDPPVLAAERGFTKRHGSFNASACVTRYHTPGFGGRRRCTIAPTLIAALLGRVLPADVLPAKDPGQTEARNMELLELRVRVRCGVAHGKVHRAFRDTRDVSRRRHVGATAPLVLKHNAVKDVFVGKCGDLEHGTHLLAAARDHRHVRVDVHPGDLRFVVFSHLINDDSTAWRAASVWMRRHGGRDRRPSPPPPPH